MSYDSWKTTDPRDSEPDYDGQNDRDIADDLDRAKQSADDSAKLTEAMFWKAVNDLAIEFPYFRVEVTLWPNA